MNNITYYQNIAREDIASNAGRNKMYADIDAMIECTFKLPEALTALEWIGNRKFISNAPRNATNAATRTFSSLMPSIQIDPLTPDEKEWERVDKMETAIEWHFKQLNVGRKKSPLWKIVESAVKYCNVSLQTEYIPYSKKRQTGKRITQIKKKGDFNFITHHPSTVNARYSDDSLECVTLCNERTVTDLIYQFGEDNEGIKRFISEMESKPENKGADLRRKKVAFFDYMDYTDRVIWFTDTQGSEMSARVGGENSAYVIKMEEHKLPFIPWVVKDNEEPLLKNVYDTWANLNIIKTIIFSKHVALAGHPSFAVEVLSQTDEVEIDNTSPLNILKLTSGQKAYPLPSLPIDPQLSKTEADLDSQIYQSSAASILGSVERLAGQGDSFSSMNAVLQAALAQLGLVRLTAEQALTEAFHQVFRWIHYSKEPLHAYRSATKDQGREDYRKGSQIVIMGGDAPEEMNNENEIWFDPDELYITVSLKSNTITDEQGRITNEINKVERLGFSRQSAYENVGGMNFEQEQEQRAAEMLFDNEVQIEVQKKQIELQLWQQQQQMQMQMQMQQAQMQQQQQAQQQAMQAQGQAPQNANQDMNAAGAFAGAQGMDMRAGGQAPQGGAPGVGREQVNQADAQGTPLV